MSLVCPRIQLIKLQSLRFEFSLGFKKAISAFLCSQFLLSISASASENLPWAALSPWRASSSLLSRLAWRSSFSDRICTISSSRSLFLFDKVPSTPEMDSSPRTSFLVLHKSAHSHGPTALDDACCWLPLAAACCWEPETQKGLELTSWSWMNSGEVDCPTSFISGVSEAATVVLKSLWSVWSVLKLFLLEGLVIGVCALLTTMQGLGSWPVRVVGSAWWSNSSPLGGVDWSSMVAEWPVEEKRRSWGRRMEPTQRWHAFEVCGACCLDWQEQRVCACRQRCSVSFTCVRQTGFPAWVAGTSSPPRPSRKVLKHSRPRWGCAWPGTTAIETRRTTGRAGAKTKLSDARGDCTPWVNTSSCRDMKRDVCEGSWPRSTSLGPARQHVGFTALCHWVWFRVLDRRGTRIGSCFACFLPILHQLFRHSLHNKRTERHLRGCFRILDLVIIHIDGEPAILALVSAVRDKVIVTEKQNTSRVRFHWRVHTSPMERQNVLCNRWEVWRGSIWSMCVRKLVLNFFRNLSGGHGHCGTLRGSTTDVPRSADSKTRSGTVLDATRTSAKPDVQERPLPEPDDERVAKEPRRDVKDIDAWPSSIVIFRCRGILDTTRPMWDDASKANETEITWSTNWRVARDPAAKEITECTNAEVTEVCEEPQPDWEALASSENVGSTWFMRQHAAQKVHLGHLWERREHEELDLPKGVKPLSIRLVVKDDYHTAKAKLTAGARARVNWTGELPQCDITAFHAAPAAGRHSRFGTDCDSWRLRSGLPPSSPSREDEEWVTSPLDAEVKPGWVW